MNYYLATIWETDRELAKLMDQLRDDEEPVVLVTFMACMKAGPFHPSCWNTRFIR